MDVIIGLIGAFVLGAIFSLILFSIGDIKPSDFHKVMNHAYTVCNQTEIDIIHLNFNNMEYSWTCKNGEKFTYVLNKEK